jgi:spore germination protein GerM
MNPGGPEVTMTLRRHAVTLVLVIGLATVGLLAYSYEGGLWWLAAKETPETERSTVAVKQAKVKAHLYFSDADHRFLTAEDRTLAQPDSVVERARALVYNLIEGSKGPLLRTIPAETKLLAIYVASDGVAYVDFDRAISNKHPGGSISELLTIFSIVNTLTLNIVEVQAVKILIEGREAKTLAGHIDIRSPFRPNMLMIK